MNFRRIGGADDFLDYLEVVLFSYEDRLRAVQRYIKLDKRIGLTIRQLGYPTKNALLTLFSSNTRSHIFSSSCLPSVVPVGF